MAAETRQQLQMLWPASLPEVESVRAPEGYTLRQFRRDDATGYYRLMDLAGFHGWDDATLEPWLARVLPDGFFVVEHNSGGALVATCMATHNPGPEHPFGGELGWVAGHPDHRGRGLGRLVCAAVTRRFLDGGYRRIYLRTDDPRLPAIITYLKLGYVPYLYAADMPDRWRVVCEQLRWPYTPDDWPAGAQTIDSDPGS